MLAVRDRVFPAVDGVSFYFRENETVDLVGESDCGKTTIGRTVLRLTDPSSGRIVFDGRDITRLSRAELRPLRREMQMIFRSEERRVGKECRSRWSRYNYNKKSESESVYNSRSRGSESA